jgi:hypothetical protein
MAITVEFVGGPADGTTYSLPTLKPTFEFIVQGDISPFDNPYDDNIEINHLIATYELRLGTAMDMSGVSDVARYVYIGQESFV